MLCRKDAGLQHAVEQAAMVLPDGIGVLYGSKILGRSLPERVAGIDFITSVFAAMAARKMRVFLLGAKPGVAELAAKRIAEANPGLVFCGTADGYFKEDEPVIEAINAAKPDLLLVCLGAPKQELWMEANQKKLDVKLMAGLCGSLDVFSGQVERAPEKWQKAGLEWLYRLKKEPKRIGRMCKLPLFLLAVLWQRIRGM